MAFLYGNAQAIRCVMSKEPEQHDAHLYDWYKWHDDEEEERMRHAMSRVRPDPEEFDEEAWRKYEKRYERRAKRDRRRRKLDEQIKTYEAAFLDSVSKGKPYADYITSLTVHSLLVGLASALLARMTEHGWSDRTAFIAFIAALMYVNMFNVILKMNVLFVETIILKLTRSLRIPGPPNTDWTSFKIVNGALSFALSTVLLCGPGFVGYELTRRTVEQIKTPPAALNNQPAAK